MEGYYLPAREKKHKSPTKRLIDQKNSIWEHKKRISKGLVRGEYSQIYSIEPGKTIVIEPQGGELPYELADSSPKKFYDMVLNQDVKKCNVLMRGALKFEWTYRPLLKILVAAKDKLIDKTVEKIGEQFRPDVERAFEKGGQLEKDMMRALEERQIDLRDEQCNLIF